MIKINLLPREERKRRTQVNPAVLLGVLGAVVVVLAMGYGWYWLNGEVNRLQADIQTTQAELKRFEELAKQVDKFQAEKKRLEEKIKVIETLVVAQGGPVRLLDEVSKALPNEVWLTTVQPGGQAAGDLGHRLLQLQRGQLHDQSGGGVRADRERGPGRVGEGRGGAGSRGAVQHHDGSQGRQGLDRREPWPSI